ncbi:methionyl-tRNA formyltransferase [Mucilaginibacter sp. L196]|uniref:methionyl-tRNA formyltransferase n=1 Tax=Mucilaginibacter sp. L196 TaxID=1641870 RepID=UPI00131C0716|nr:formyltransferase family protein [Mucilaginibacter sp. L196]
MKIILLANHVYAIPAISFLASKQLLKAVVMPDVVHEHNLQVENAATFNNIPYKRFAKEDLKTSFKEWLTQQEPDLVIAYTFSYKIPADLFSIPVYGFYNVHYSLLPAYMGPFPVFWQIKNGEKKGGISIHHMDENFDTGPVFIQQEIAILPGETQGLYSAKLSVFSVNLIQEFISKIKIEQPLTLTPTQSYHPRPEPKDFTIYWDKNTASEIENLTNACNTEIGGAITSFRGQMIRVLEVAKATVNGAAASLPGTIVYSDTANGIYVACKNNEYLKLNVLQTAEGIFSGNKFASIGIQAGESFN